MSFETATIVFGALVIGGALVSGIAGRSFLSLTAIFVLAGFGLGEGGLEVVQLDPRSGFVEALALVALILILFRDGLEVEAEMLQHAWRLPLRKLVVAMPITALVVALAAKLLVGLGWTEALLLGALLSPTDPVLSSSVVTNPRVPRVIRHSLNLESGLNDGLALPPVLAFSAALAADRDFVWWRFVLQDVTVGVLSGLVIGYLASRLVPRGTLERSLPAHQRALYGLGVAFLAYGVTVVLEHGNGVIAVFVCAMTLGIRRPDIRHYVAQRSADIIELVKLGVFVVFGSLLTLDHLFADGWAAVAIVAVTLLVARPVAVWIALAGTGVDTAAKAFMAWFGPKGVATMTFSLLVLGQDLAAGRQIFDLAAIVVVCSVLAHGLTDHAGVDWIARRAPDEPLEPPAAAAGPATAGERRRAGSARSRP